MTLTAGLTLTSSRNLIERLHRELKSTSTLVGLDLLALLLGCYRRHKKGR